MTTSALRSMHIPFLWWPFQDPTMTIPDPLSLPFSDGSPSPFPILTACWVLALQCSVLTHGSRCVLQLCGTSRVGYELAV